ALHCEQSVGAPMSGPLSLTFGVDGNGSKYTEDGWSAPERGYTWTVGSKATILIPNPGARGPCLLKLRYGVFIPPGRAYQRAAISIAGQTVATWVAAKNAEMDFWV